MLYLLNILGYGGWFKKVYSFDKNKLKNTGANIMQMPLEN